MRIVLFITFFILFGCSETKVLKNTLFDNNIIKNSQSNTKTCFYDPFYCTDIELCKKARNGIGVYVDEARKRKLKCIPNNNKFSKEKSNEIIISYNWKKLKNCIFHSGFYQNANYYALLNLSNNSSFLTIGHISKNIANKGLATIKIDNQKSFKEEIITNSGYKSKLNNKMDLTWRNKFFNQLIKGDKMIVSTLSNTFKISLKDISNFMYEIKKCRS